ncbi:MAG: hypothetical protein ACI85Q_001911 [Salibacteraceae bacterium]|jgi:hypothetical protein
MLNIIKALLLLFTIICFKSVYSSEHTYSEKFSVESVELTFSEFDELLNETKSLVTRLNGPTNKKVNIEALIVNRKGELFIENWTTFEDIKFNDFQKAEIKIHFLGGEAITFIEFKLNNEVRNIEIEGGNLKDIENIKQVLIVDFREKVSFWTLPLFKMYFTRGILILGAVLFWVKFKARKEDDFTEKEKRDRIVYSILWLTALALWGIISFLSNELGMWVFSSFYVSREEVSIYLGVLAVLTPIALVLSLVIPIIKPILKFFKESFKDDE